MLTRDGHQMPPAPPEARQARRASIAVVSVLAALMLAIAVGAIVQQQREAAEDERIREQISDLDESLCFEGEPGC